MKKILIVPDSFKGTLTATEICETVKEKALKFFDAQVITVPVADGGEGSVDCFLTALGGRRVNLKVKGPFFNTVEASYGVIGDTAVIETASCASLSLAGDKKDPLITTTFGVGEQILHAAKNGLKKIIVGLGGSCTNDLGAGAACACGVKFIGKKGEFIPTGGTLKDIESINLSGIEKSLYGVKITAMCDVNNPPFGKFGAARIFAPQKGANEKSVELLDRGVKHACEIIKREYKTDLSELKGGGAAGAFATGLKAFFNAELKMGIEVVLDTVKFDELLDGADMVITGEGKLDLQSVRGKVISGITKRCTKKGVPVIAIVGGAEGDMEEVYKSGVSAVFTINRLPQDLSVSKNYSKENLSKTAEDIFRLIKCISKNDN